MCANGYFAAALDATTSQCLACSIDCATCAAPGNTCSSCRPGYIVKVCNVINHEFRMEDVSHLLTRIVLGLITLENV